MLGFQVYQLLVTVVDLNNFESDPEEFARIFCEDLGIEDPEVGPAIAFAIREQLCEVSILLLINILMAFLAKC
ncbi:hypothetical protein M8C21_024258, partial [Ambrosia artemisiifolia]